MEKAKILLVDDRPENLLALAGVLQAEDREFIQATSGKQALEYLMQHSFAVAILDVQMPEMDGFELAELMRSSEDTQSIPIMFVTAGVRDPKSTFRGFEAGAVDFLHKPLDERIVRSKVNVFLELHRKTRQLKEKIAQLELSQTELKKSQAALSRSNQELEKFAYIASHDIKEPLRMISLSLGMLAHHSGKALDTESAKLLDTATKGALRLGALVQSLVSHSKVNGVDLELAPTNLTQLVNDVLSDLSAAIQEKNATVAVNPLPSIVCDATLFRQLMQNLISNALKFNGAAPRVEVGYAKQPNAYLFSVTDNGIGIPPEQFKKIFEPFVRGHSRHEFAGDGIGLSVCKTIVERHGGSIWVESDGAHGSTFYFTISEQPADRRDA